LTDVVFVVLGEIAAERASDVVGRHSEDVDGDAADFGFADAFGVAAETFESLTVFDGQLVGFAHQRLLDHSEGTELRAR